MRWRHEGREVSWRGWGGVDRPCLPKVMPVCYSLCIHHQCSLSLCLSLSPNWISVCLCPGLTSSVVCESDRPPGARRRAPPPGVCVSVCLCVCVSVCVFAAVSSERGGDDQLYGVSLMHGFRQRKRLTLCQHEAGGISSVILVT